ncbi:MAG: hypothetical protein SGILL_010091 [Bacillariaceae sp.]
MTWANTWKDILSGGSPRWKVDDVAIKQQALSYISKYMGSEQQQEEKKQNIRILCPLAGDDPFVHFAWKQGYSVTAIDLVPDALGAIRKQFAAEKDWQMEIRPSGSKVWNHVSGRATLYEGDVLEKRTELLDSFDAVYDKDSFGALDKEMRQPFCMRLADYTKDGGIVYTEVKYKDANSPSRNFGPPFHVEKNDLMEATSFGGSFVYVDDLGKVYDLATTGVEQTAHVLQRKAREPTSAR